MNKFKEYFGKIKEVAEKLGLKLSVGFLIYTLIIVVIAVQADRLYFKYKIQSEFKKAQNEMQKLLGGDAAKSKEKPKKWKFLAPKPQKVEINSVITDKDNFEATIKKSQFLNRLNPPKMKEWSVYTYYEPKDSNNTLLDVVVDIKNLGTSEVSNENIITSSKAVYDSKYEYDSYTVVENADGYDFSSSDNINPLQTMKIHILTEIPKAAKSDDKPVILTMEMGGKEYELSIKTPENNNQHEVTVENPAMQTNTETTTQEAPAQKKATAKPTTTAKQATTTKHAAKPATNHAEPQITHESLDLLNEGNMRNFLIQSQTVNPKEKSATEKAKELF